MCYIHHYVLFISVFGHIGSGALGHWRMTHEQLGMTHEQLDMTHEQLGMIHEQWGLIHEQWL